MTMHNSQTQRRGTFALPAESHVPPRKHISMNKFSDYRRLYRHPESVQVLPTEVFFSPRSCSELPKVHDDLNLCWNIRAFSSSCCLRMEGLWLWAISLHDFYWTVSGWNWGRIQELSGNIANIFFDAFTSIECQVSHSIRKFMWSVSKSLSTIFLIPVNRKYNRGINYNSKALWTKIPRDFESKPLQTSIKRTEWQLKQTQSSLSIRSQIDFNLLNDFFFVFMLELTTFFDSRDCTCGAALIAAFMAMAE